uniref:uncharacterized protein isoform X2 n=1 Tax=Myxine glutinosa TaxID=7769 RepID=UPI00358EB7C5
MDPQVVKVSYLHVKLSSPQHLLNGQDSKTKVGKEEKERRVVEEELEQRGRGQDEFRGFGNLGCAQGERRPNDSFEVCGARREQRHETSPSCHILSLHQQSSMNPLDPSSADRLQLKECPDTVRRKGRKSSCESYWNLSMPGRMLNGSDERNGEDDSTDKAGWIQRGSCVEHSQTCGVTDPVGFMETTTASNPHSFLCGHLYNHCCDVEILNNFHNAHSTGEVETMMGTLRCSHGGGAEQFGTPCASTYHGTHHFGSPRKPIKCRQLPFYKGDTPTSPVLPSNPRWKVQVSCVSPLSPEQHAGRQPIMQATVVTAMPRANSVNMEVIRLQGNPGKQGGSEGVDGDASTKEEFFLCLGQVTPAGSQHLIKPTSGCFFSPSSLSPAWGYIGAGDGTPALTGRAASPRASENIRYGTGDEKTETRPMRNGEASLPAWPFTEQPMLSDDWRRSLEIKSPIGDGNGGRSVAAGSEDNYVTIQEMPAQTDQTWIGQRCGACTVADTESKPGLSAECFKVTAVEGHWSVPSPESSRYDGRFAAIWEVQSSNAATQDSFVPVTSSSPTIKDALSCEMSAETCLEESTTFASQFSTEEAKYGVMLEPGTICHENPNKGIAAEGGLARLMVREIQRSLQPPLFLQPEELQDSFSKQAESILESHRSAGMACSSLDSLDILNAATEDEQIDHDHNDDDDYDVLCTHSSGSNDDVAVMTDGGALSCIAGDHAFKQGSEGQPVVWRLSSVFQEKQLESTFNSEVSTESTHLLQDPALPMDQSLGTVDLTINHSSVSFHQPSDGQHACGPDKMATVQNEESSIVAENTSITLENIAEPQWKCNQSNGPSAPCVVMSTTDPTGSSTTAGVSANGSHPDQDAARQMANRLYYLDGFKRSDIAQHLYRNNEFSRVVCEEYLMLFDFVGLSLDQALRMFLKALVLVGETQERERILAQFSRWYCHSNPNSGLEEDGVHTLTCSVMLLNTDLHGPNIRKKMSKQMFIDNLAGMNNGGNFSKEMLTVFYNSIKLERLEWAVDDDDDDEEFHQPKPGLRTSYDEEPRNLVLSGLNPFQEIPADPNAVTYYCGLLHRKLFADTDHKKAPLGKRSWKSFYAVLKGMILYLYKNERSNESTDLGENLKTALSIHHALARPDKEHSRHRNVFRLQTADWKVFLFYTRTAEEMDSWVKRINLVAATFSAPPLPAAVGSQRRFSRPLLPASMVKLSQEEQLKAHETKLRMIITELVEHQSYPPDRRVRGRELQDYKLKLQYLDFEKCRYEMYISALQARLLAGTDDLKAFEMAWCTEPEGPGYTGMSRAHSNPMLNHEASPPDPSMIRRILSERRAHDAQ